MNNSPHPLYIVFDYRINYNKHLNDGGRRIVVCTPHNSKDSKDGICYKHSIWYDIDKNIRREHEWDFMSGDWDLQTMMNLQHSSECNEWYYYYSEEAFLATYAWILFV